MFLKRSRLISVKDSVYKEKILIITKIFKSIGHTDNCRKIEKLKFIHLFTSTYTFYKVYFFPYFSLWTDTNNNPL